MPSASSRASASVASAVRWAITSVFVMESMLGAGPAAGAGRGARRALASACSARFCSSSTPRDSWLRNDRTCSGSYPLRTTGKVTAAIAFGLISMADHAYAPACRRIGEACAGAERPPGVRAHAPAMPAGGSAAEEP